jgi:hypothetical protein
MLRGLKKMQAMLQWTVDHQNQASLTVLNNIASRISLGKG